MYKKSCFLFIVAALCIGPLRPAFADPLLDQIDAAFVGHAKASMEFNSDGKSRPGFLDNFIEVGHFNGVPIAAADLGITGTIIDSGKLNAGQFSTGAKIHLAPFIRSYLNLTPEWQFLGTLEIDARGSYDWTNHHPFYGIAVAYPIK